MATIIVPNSPHAKPSIRACTNLIFKADFFHMNAESITPKKEQKCDTPSRVMADFHLVRAWNLSW